MSISSVNNCYVPSSMPALESEVPVSENVPEQNALAQTDVKPLTPEERRQKMKESNMRYMFDQMIASQRRYTQDMQKQIREQQDHGVTMQVYDIYSIKAIQQTPTHSPESRIIQESVITNVCQDAFFVSVNIVLTKTNKLAVVIV